MFKVKTSYVLPTGHTLTNEEEFYDQNSAEEFFDRWHRAYNVCIEESKIVEFIMVMTEIREMYSVVSSKG